MATLGVVVFSLDKMKHLAQCLESVAWADHVMLLHAGCSDPAIGQEFPALTVRRLSSWRGVEKHSRDLDTDWVLWLWGDERLDSTLTGELRALKIQPHIGSTRAYKISVRSYILNRWVEGSVWGPSPAVRLSCAKDIPCAWWEKKSDAEKISRGYIEDRGAAELSAAVEYVQALSDFWAAQLMQLAQPPGALKTILASAGVKIKMLFHNRNFGRGLSGIALSALASYCVLLSGAKMWEARHVKTPGAPE
ncbi:MAG TPA: hypothetical protein VL754_05170 [Verrucomicrobiae bacterium]|nr:hypothetical protein [Verrucomicrobiae bacterium]